MSCACPDTVRCLLCRQTKRSLIFSRLAAKLCRAARHLEKTAHILKRSVGAVHVLNSQTFLWFHDVHSICTSGCQLVRLNMFMLCALTPTFKLPLSGGCKLSGPRATTPHSFLAGSCLLMIVSAWRIIPARNIKLSDWCVGNFVSHLHWPVLDSWTLCVRSVIC